MNKKLLVPVFLCFLVLFMPVLLDAQSAEDIIVPDGYTVEKIAETNNAPDPWGLTFDSSGNLIVASNVCMIYRVDQSGNVEIITQTRRFNLGPEDIEIAPDGNYIVLCRERDSGGKKIFKFIPPDNFIPLTEAHNFMTIAYDKLGNFYACIRETDPTSGRVVRYDSSFNEVENVISSLYRPLDFGFDSANNMYVDEYAESGEGKIWKIPAGENGIPGPEDTPIELVSGLQSSGYITVDDSGNLYVTEWTHNETDGFSKYYKSRILKVDSQTGSSVQLATDLADPGGLAYRDGFIYASEYQRAVISKIDIYTGNKTDYTPDYGICFAGAIAFDSNDNLYTSGGRDEKLFRLNESGTFEQVGEGTGWFQTIASDGIYFYVVSIDSVGENENQILRIDPIAETMEVVGTQYDGHRSVAFDSYGRLILSTDLGDGEFGLDIIDLYTGEATTYVTGIHNEGRCIQFDADQNLYVKEGIGDGIKKVYLEQNYYPPRDISDEPLFYDFTAEPYPPAIYFFYVNELEEVYIPLLDVGKILKGDTYGNTEVFAEGFLCPGHVTYDKYGVMYVSDVGNGIFKISPLVTISGVVRTSAGIGIEGVTITFSSEGGTATTSSDGNYSHTLIYGWSGTATPSKEGYAFSPPSRTYSNVTSDQIDQNYTASLIQFALTIGIGTGGTTQPSPGSYNYDYGTQVAITAIPDSGYEFSGWSGDASGTSNPITITMNSAKSITANFIRRYTLTIAAGTGGITDPVPGAYTYDSGTQVTITAIPDTNYRFVSWSGDASSTSNPITITMDSDKSITANFIRRYTLTIAAGTDGTTNPVPETYTHDSGTAVTIRAIPDANYRFANWSGDASGTSNPITITMSSNKSITANFSAVEEEEEAEKKGPCFIATAAYSSPLHPHVNILRDFRDRYLMPSKLGRALVNLYYKYSPFVADFIAKHKVLKFAVRFSLMPLVAFSYSIVHFGPIITSVIFVFIFMLPLFFIAFWRKRIIKTLENYDS